MKNQTFFEIEGEDSKKMSLITDRRTQPTNLFYDTRGYRDTLHSKLEPALLGLQVRF